MHYFVQPQAIKTSDSTEKATRPAHCWRASLSPGPNPRKSVRQLISLRFINHVYSDLALVAASLLYDAQACERSAFEAYGAFQLVSLCPEYAEQYEKEEFPKPVKVRLLVEQYGEADIVTQLRRLVYKRRARGQTARMRSQRGRHGRRSAYRLSSWKPRLIATLEACRIGAGAFAPLHHSRPTRLRALFGTTKLRLHVGRFSRLR